MTVSTLEPECKGLVMDVSEKTDRVEGAAQSQVVSTAKATQTRDVDPLSVTKRLQRDGRWAEVEPIRNRLIKECRQQGMSKPDAQAWTYSELDRLYPPPETERTACSDYHLGSAEGGNVTGLSDIPGNWPEMPSNASLGAEVSWVQANRLRVVRESADRVTVDLSKALSPAPSYATLGWLETSIKTYAKFVDVAAKATASQDGEAAEIRREVQSIAEVRRILAEMLEG
jgi:hypothetical protein